MAAIASIGSESEEGAGAQDVALAIASPATIAQGTRFVFTLNVPTWDPAHKLLDQLDEASKVGQFKLLRAQFEVGEAGNKHVQGAVQFATNKRYAALRAFIPGAHWEAMKDRGAAAFLYCEKTDSLPPEGERRSVKFGEIKCEAPCVLCGTK